MAYQPARHFNFGPHMLLDVHKLILDSGADVSGLPMTYSGIGQPLARCSIVRDAEGRKMGGGELRRAVVVLQDAQGNVVQLKETFVLRM